jgi:hypothetical protein
VKEREYGGRKGIKDKKPRFRRSRREIALGLTEEQAREERERVKRVAKAEEFMKREEAEKKRIEKLKMAAGNKTRFSRKTSAVPKIKRARIAETAPRKKEFRQIIRQKLREFMRQQRRFANSDDLIAAIRKNAAIELANDPLINRDLYRKSKIAEKKESENQPSPGFDSTLSI